jgi:HK97 family phage major capsid protein
MPQKKQLSFQEELEATLTAMAAKIHDTRGELLRVLEPLARANERENLLRSYEARMASGTQRGSALERIRQDAGKRELWSALLKVKGGAASSRITPEEHALVRALTTGTEPGSHWIGEEAAGDLIDAASELATFSTLGFRVIRQGRKRFIKLGGTPSATWISPAAQGAALQPVPIDGAAISGEGHTLGVLIEPSLDVYSDADIDLDIALPQIAAAALGAALDRAVYSGQGAGDTANSEFTGIFFHPDVPVETADVIQFESLKRTDFLRPIGAISAGALQRPCRWWISVDLQPIALTLRDFDDSPLFKPPTTEGGAWMLCGYPVTWTTGAPAANEPEARVAAFGHGPAYAVALREQIEIATSAHVKFDTGAKQIRVTSRVICEMVDARDFAVLRLGVNE